MEYIIVPIVAFLSSALTLLSGFGLGMMLSAALFLFFPLDIAVALTAIVHFANNILKIGLFKAHIDKTLVLRFGIPAIICAVIGAKVLNLIAHSESLGSFTVFGETVELVPLKITLGVLMIVFAYFKPNPKHTEKRSFLVYGGILSGFFGGLAGHQGGVRSAFLTKLDLKKETFIASGVAIACLIDISRISIYALDGKLNPASESVNIMLLSIICAFLGVFLGKKMMEKTTYKTIQWIVKTLLTVQGIFIILNRI